MLKWLQQNAKAEDLRAILSHKLDRVCRNMRDAVRLQELEDQCGVQLSFVENQFGPGAAGQLSFNVMAAVAQYYSDNLRSEVLKGMDERVRQGWPTGLAPYGYVNVDDKDEPVQPHPEKARTVVRIFELYATGEYTLHNKSTALMTEYSDPSRGETAMRVFEWSQRAADVWRGSNNGTKRQILNAVSLNRTLSDVSLVTEKRNPFDLLAERPFLKNTRGDWI